MGQGKRGPEDSGINRWSISTMDLSRISFLKRETTFEFLCVVCAQRWSQQAVALWRTGLLLCFLHSCTCLGKIPLLPHHFSAQIHPSFLKTQDPDSCSLHRRRMCPWHSGTPRLTALLLPSTPDLQEFFRRVEKRRQSDAQIGLRKRPESRRVKCRRQHTALKCCRGRELLSGAASS